MDEANRQDPPQSRLPPQLDCALIEYCRQSSHQKVVTGRQELIPVPYRRESLLFREQADHRAGKRAKEEIAARH